MGREYAYEVQTKHSSGTNGNTKICGRLDEGKDKANPNKTWPILVATAWAIWIHRNNIIFRNEKINPQAIPWPRKRKIKEVIYKHTRPHQERGRSWKWGIENQDNNTLIIDGAWKEPKSGEIRAAYGWAMEQEGRCNQVGASRIFAASPLQAEAYALLEGSTKATNHWTTITIWTDSTKLIQLLHNPESAPSSCYLLILDILNLLKTFVACKILKVSRSCVKKAHDLTIQVRSRN
ncbi:putative potassium transport system protein kup 1 [Bienertia sinuspersici]